jgi:hypothetical protein
VPCDCAVCGELEAKGENALHALRRVTVTRSGAALKAWETRRKAAAGREASA